MKSLEELKAIREKMKGQVEIRQEDEGAMRVVVGMATCGIAAGARPVLAAFSNGVQERGLSGISVVQTGCIGLCQFEPIVEIHAAGGEKTTYVKVTPEMAEEIIGQHLVNGKVLTKYTIESVRM